MLSEQLANAFTCAHAFHRDQRRKGRDRPYIGHLMAVASLVLDADGDEDAAIAGLLHDALEDQGGSRAANEIERQFGREVLGVVRECSDWSGDGENPAWRSRKLAFVNSVSAMSSRALLVAAMASRRPRLVRSGIATASFRAGHPRRGHEGLRHHGGEREGGVVWHVLRRGRRGERY